MNRLLRLLGYRDRRYQCSEFQVSIEPVFREAASVLYTRGESKTQLNAEYIGKKSWTIGVSIPAETNEADARRIAADLAIAFNAMGYAYVIVRKVGVEVVPEEDRNAALAELKKMGYEIELLPDGKIRQSGKRGSPPKPIDFIRKETPRMMQLMKAVHGRREKLETLAQSKDFE